MGLIPVSQTVMNKVLRACLHVPVSVKVYHGARLFGWQSNCRTHSVRQMVRHHWQNVKTLSVMDTETVCVNRSLKMTSCVSISELPLESETKLTYKLKHLLNGHLVLQWNVRDSNSILEILKLYGTRKVTLQEKFYHKCDGHHYRGIQRWKSTHAILVRPIQLGLFCSTLENEKKMSVTTMMKSFMYKYISLEYFVQ